MSISTVIVRPVIGLSAIRTSRIRTSRIRTSRLGAQRGWAVASDRRAFERGRADAMPSLRPFA